MLRFTSCAIISALAVGCGANALDVGSDLGDTNSPSGTGGSGAGVGGSSAVDCSKSSTAPALPPLQTPDSCAAASDRADLVGEWDGYYQGTSIDDEASTFCVKVYGASATDGLCGTITFGIHSPVATFPVATDPMAAPPGTPAAVNTFDAWVLQSELGAPYSIVDGKVDGQRVTFRHSISEIYQSWCTIQTSYPIGGVCTSFACLPADRLLVNGIVSGDPTATCYNDSASGRHYYTCAQLELCTGMYAPVCDCDATHCQASMERSFLFDLVISGNNATGVEGTRSVILNKVTTAN